MRPGPRLFAKSRPLVTVSEMLQWIKDQDIDVNGTFVSVDVEERTIVLDSGIDEWRIQC